MRTAHAILEPQIDAAKCKDWGPRVSSPGAEVREGFHLTQSLGAGDGT